MGLLCHVCIEHRFVFVNATLHDLDCKHFRQEVTRSSAIAEGPRDASCQLISWQLPRNSAETTCTTSPEQIEVMKSEVGGLRWADV